MKNSILILLFTFCSLAYGQISFESAGTPVDSLNTPMGQNYLVINPHNQAMAYTEEKGGLPTQVGPYQKLKRNIHGVVWQVYIFSDWLGEKGMKSPIGFDASGIFYNEVDFAQGIYMGRVKYATSDGRIEEVNIPYFKNKSPIQSGCLSKDSRYMILSMESNHTYGVEDLYVVKRKPDGTWSGAENLGYHINTEFQEVTPFLAADNRTLFFATNGRGGQGSFDVYYTVRQDDSWRSWSEPINLGPKVNTTGAETSFTFLGGGEWAYYVSSQDSDGYGDIMRIKFSKSIGEDSTIMEAPMIQAEGQSRNTEGQSRKNSKIMIKVVDAKTRQPISAEMIINAEKQSSNNGYFVIDSLSGEEVEIKSLGYLPKKVMLDEQLEPGINEVGLESLAKGSVIVLNHVLFHRGTATMIEGSEKELGLVVEMMKDNPTIKILLKGHTDNTGDPVKNVQLSEARVRTVKEYILAQGISPYRVRGKGYGGNQPIASNATEETRKLNRRVEFEVVEN